MGGPYVPREGQDHPATENQQNQVQPQEPDPAPAPAPEHHAEPDPAPAPEQQAAEPDPAPANVPDPDEHLTFDPPGEIPEPLTPEQHAEAQAEQGAAPAEEYVPDFTFKVMDQTYQFDERTRAAIVDKESEEYYRELNQRAYGLDYVKDDRTALRQENQQLMQFREKFAPVKTDLDFAMERLKSQDFESFKDIFGIPDEMVFDYARTKARLADPETPPEFRSTYERNRENAQANYDLYHQNQMLSGQARGDAGQQIASELEQVLSHPEVQQYAHEWDSRTGKPGSFRQAIVEKGQLHHMKTGVDMRPAEVVQQLATMYPRQEGYQPQYPRPALPPLTPYQPQQGGYGAPPAPRAPQMQQPPPQMGAAPPRAAPAGRPPVIPHTPGSGASPVKSQVRSIDQIRELANEAN